MSMLSDYITARRLQLRLSQKEVVERMRDRGVDREAATLSNWETGRAVIPVEVIPALALALEEKSPVVLYKLAGILANLPGSKIVELLDGLPEDEVERIERMISAYFEDHE